MLKLAVYCNYFDMSGLPIWSPVKQEDVPEWLNDPEIVANLMVGNAVQNSDFGPLFYKGRIVETSN